MTSRAHRLLLLLVAAAALGLVTLLGCSSGTNPATDDYVVTCVSPGGTVWAGDGAASTVSAIVARSGSSVSGAPVQFAADAGAIEGEVTTDAGGFADADFFPPFAPGPVQVTTEVWDAGDLLADDSCAFTVSPALTLSATPVAGTPASPVVDPDCDVPVLLDVDVSVDPVTGVPATVPLGVGVTGYRATWRRPDGSGTPGVDVPRDVTGALAAGPTTAPTVFALAGLELIDPMDVPALACDEEQILVVTVSLDVGPAVGSGTLVTDFSLTVTFRRSCDPCP